MNTIFDIEQKQDSPEKLAAVAGIPERFYINADEFNDVTRSALQAAIENVKIDFTWSNKTEHRKLNWNNFDLVQLLVMNFRAEWMLQNTDEVWLLIDRYKSKKAVRNDGYKFKQSGFKHSVYPDENYPKRPSEILIKDKMTILNFGQVYYFHPINQPNIEALKLAENNKIPISYNTNIRAAGFGGKNNYENRKAWVYFQFRIKVKKGDKVFYSNPKATIQMICQRIEGEKISISYKLL